MVSSNKIVFGFVILLVPANIFAAPVSKIDKNVKSGDKVSTIRVPNDVTPEIRKLAGPHISALNTVLALFPATTVRIDVTKGRASEARQRAHGRLGISNRDSGEDASFVQSEFATIIEPIREFLEFIKNHKVTARGIIIQCLESQNYRQGLEATDSFLYKFIEQIGSIDSIAAQEITSVHDLHVLSKDVEALSGAIVESLSAEARTAFDATRQILIEKRSAAK